MPILKHCVWVQYKKITPWETERQFLASRSQPRSQINYQMSIHEDLPTWVQYPWAPMSLPVGSSMSRLTLKTEKKIRFMKAPSNYMSPTLLHFWLIYMYAAFYTEKKSNLNWNTRWMRHCHFNTDNRYSVAENYSGLLIKKLWENISYPLHFMIKVSRIYSKYLLKVGNLMRFLWKYERIS